MAAAAPARIGFMHAYCFACRRVHAPRSIRFRVNEQEPHSFGEIGDALRRAALVWRETGKPVTISISLDWCQTFQVIAEFRTLQDGEELPDTDPTKRGSDLR